MSRHLLLLLSLALQCPCAHSFISSKNTFRLRNAIRLNAKQKIKINTNVAGDISLDGLLAAKKEEQKERNAARATVKSNLGISTKKKKDSSSTEKVQLSKKRDKISKQRNGSVDSRLQAGLSVPEDQLVQVQVVTRGIKKVTLIRGLTSSMDDRKLLLKELKTSLGGGGTMVEGVLELQGAHGENVFQYLIQKGYSKAKIIK